MTIDPPPPSGLALQTLESLLEVSPHATYALDPMWRLVLLNRAAETYFGLERTNVLGLHIWDVAPDSRGGIFEANLTSAMAGSASKWTTTSIVQPGRSVEVEMQPLAGGGAAVFLRDLTEAERLDAEAREARRLSEQSAAEQAVVLAQLAEGVIVADADGRITFVNEAAERLHGQSLLSVSPDSYSDAYRLFTEAGEPYPPDDLPLTRAVRDGEVVVDSRWRIRRPDGTEVLAIGSARPIRAPDGAQIGAVLTIRDDTLRTQAEAALRESEEDYRHAAELNPQVAWTAAPDGQLDRVATRWLEWTGTTGLGSTYADALHPEDVEPTFEVWGRSVTTGEPYDIVHRMRRTTGDIRWIRSRAYPRRDAEGRIVRWYGTTEDIHEQKLGEEHLKLMVLELNHRVKNNLATVQAIATQTLRAPGDNAAVREALMQRISALAAAHDVLTRQQWEGAGVREVALAVLDALHEQTAGRVECQGEPVRLTAGPALSLSMAFHELGTNALKYGALSVPQGRVSLTWTHDVAQGRLSIRWVERDGPPVTTPPTRGFGSRLLERGLAGELNGQVEMRFAREGLECDIDIPMSRDIAPPNDPA